MATVQSTYNRYQAVAAAGMPATMHGYNGDTRICETAAGIGFGLVVSRGVNDKGCVLGGSTPCGVTIRDQTLAASAVDKYPQYANVGLMIDGDIWLVATGAVANGDLLKYDATTGAPGSSGLTTIGDAVWQTTAGNGSLGICRLGGMFLPIT